MSGGIPQVQYPADNELRQINPYGEFHCRPYARWEDVRRQPLVAEALGSQRRRLAARMGELLKESSPAQQLTGQCFQRPAH